MDSILEYVLLLGREILLADFLHTCMFSSCTVAVFLLAFTNWPLSLVVGRAMTKIRGLIGI